MQGGAVLSPETQRGREQPRGSPQPAPSSELKSSVHEGFLLVN